MFGTGGMGGLGGGGGAAGGAGGGGMGMVMNLLGGGDKQETFPSTVEGVPQPSDIQNRFLAFVQENQHLPFRESDIPDIPQQQQEQILSIFDAGQRAGELELQQAQGLEQVPTDGVI